MAAARGLYAKGVVKRAEILETALQVVAEEGYSGATVKQIADAVGLSQTGMLHYFGSKDALFREILRRRDEINYASFGDPDHPPAEPINHFVDLIRHNAMVPGLVQLYSRLSNESAEPAHPSHDYFQERYELSRQIGRTVLERLQADDRIPPDLDPAQLAVLLAALSDGLQTQWMYDQSLDMAAHIEYFLRLIGLQPEASPPPAESKGRSGDGRRRSRAPRR
ncbi:helix-turn-helix domain-containing protein [Nonomuraea sp. NPDC026600]|uniref:TetR/AcrR family transcriptional regulator n=1 Tax=Nonomuraea sp. NPDC026600 TaxID=3155363 RepID=UPI0033E99C72